MLHIRPATVDDLEAVVAIRNRIWPEPITAADVKCWDEAFAQRAGTHQQRLVADLDGRIVGYGMLKHYENEPADLYVGVAESARRQGIGQRLYAALLELAPAFGATELRAFVQGTDDESYAWALARGYHLERQRTESVLDLRQWDDEAWAGNLARVADQGIQLVGMTAYPEENLLRQIYAVSREAAMDIPGRDWVFPEYDQWVISFAATYHELPPALGLALDGERLVGLSVLEMPRVKGAGAEIDLTGVLRAYRGRGIALAVKLLTHREAVAAGVSRIRTNNDADNPPMLAVNQKLGFVFVPGPRRMKKSLREA